MENRSLSKVSVIIPCYNDGEYLEDAIQSVVKQTYGNIEIIIVNDGSTSKSTMKCLLEIESKYSLKLIHTFNLGPSVARNKAIQACSGEFILPLDADDVIAESYVEKAVNILQQQKTVGIVYCKADFFGMKNGPWILPPFSPPELAWANMIFNCALFRKLDWQNHGGYDVDFIHGEEDYDLWIKFVKSGLDVVCIPEILFHYRIKKSSRTSQLLNSDGNKIVQTKLLSFRKHKDFYMLHINHIVRRRLELEIKAASITVTAQKGFFKKVCDYCIMIKNQLKSNNNVKTS